MCTLQIFMQCYDKFYELTLDEQVSAELFVEDMVGHVLLNLFGQATVDDVTIQCTSKLSISSPHCSISIRAQCSCEEFVGHSHSQEYMKYAIEQAIVSIFKELFVDVKFDNIILCPSQWQCKRGARLSYRS